MNNQAIVSEIERITPRLANLYPGPFSTQCLWNVIYGAGPVAPSLLDKLVISLHNAIEWGQADYAEEYAREAATEAYDNYLGRRHCPVTGNVYFDEECC